MCDACEHAAGYVLPIEDYTDSNVGPMKSYASSFRIAEVYRWPDVTHDEREGVPGYELCV